MIFENLTDIFTLFGIGLVGYAVGKLIEYFIKRGNVEKKPK